MIHNNPCELYMQLYKLERTGRTVIDCMLVGYVWCRFQFNSVLIMYSLTRMMLSKCSTQSCSSYLKVQFLSKKLNFSKI